MVEILFETLCLIFSLYPNNVCNELKASSQIDSYSQQRSQVTQEGDKQILCSYESPSGMFEMFK